MRKARLLLASDGLHVRLTLLDSPSYLVDESGAAVQECLRAAAVEVPEQVRVSAGRCGNNHRGHDGNSDADRDSRYHLWLSAIVGCLNFMGRRSRCRQREVAIRLRGMLRAVCSDAGPNEVPGTVAVQVAVFRHVSCDVGRLPTEIKFIAHLMTGNDRGLR
jgi:hypothetical protein